MKKIVGLVVVALMIAAVAFAAGKVAITEKNLGTLKGTWTGFITFGVTEQGTSSPVTVEILNDTVPVKARITIADVPGFVQQYFGGSGGQKSGESDDGQLTTQGTLFFTGPEKNFFEFTLRSDKKLDCWYYLRGLRGNANGLKKK